MKMEEAINYGLMVLLLKVLKLFKYTYITYFFKIGNWKDGKFSGYGRHTWASGSTYEGNWVDHKRNGWGCNSWAQKDLYTGEWVDDEKDGN